MPVSMGGDWVDTTAPGIPNTGEAIRVLYNGCDHYDAVGGKFIPPYH
jgi:hypothetical protein